MGILFIFFAEMAVDLANSDGAELYFRDPAAYQLPIGMSGCYFLKGGDRFVFILGADHLQCTSVRGLF